MKGTTGISPTLLCASQLQLEEELRRLDQLDILWHHVDVMDGHFVPNLAFGLLTLQEICRHSSHPVYGHFMVTNPEDYVEACAEMKLDYFVFHLEAERNPFRLVQKIRQCGMKPGIALNPITPAEAAVNLLPLVDAVTVMAVEPGFSGQEFLPFSYEKIRSLARRKKEDNFLLEVDGGVTMENAPACAACGADVLVGGAFTLFQKDAPLEHNFSCLKRILEQTQEGME